MQTIVHHTSVACMTRVTFSILEAIHTVFTSSPNPDCNHSLLSLSVFGVEREGQGAAGPCHQAPRHPGWGHYHRSAPTVPHQNQQGGPPHPKKHQGQSRSTS